MFSVPFPLNDYTSINARTPFEMYGRLPQNIRTKIHHFHGAARAGLIGSSIGATIGGALTAQSESNPVAGSVIGGIAGGAIGAASAHAIHHPVGTLEIIGAPAYALGSGIVKSFTSGKATNFLENVGMGSVKFGEAALKGVELGTEMGIGVLAKTGVRATHMASHFLKADPNEMIGYKFNTAGKMLATAGALTKGIVGGFSTFNKLHQGTIEPGIVRATPQPVYSSMMDNAGATGDLVFALHNNRRG